MKAVKSKAKAGRGGREGPGAGAGAEWDSGRRAQFISNASFATLSLIYSFTEVADLSERLAELAGLTARLSHLTTVRHPLSVSTPSRFHSDSSLFSDQQSHLSCKLCHPSHRALDVPLLVPLTPTVSELARYCMRAL